MVRKRIWNPDSKELVYSEEKQFSECVKIKNIELMQSTQLRDSAGDEIFPGDFVKDIKMSGSGSVGEVKNRHGNDLEVVLLNGKVVFWMPQATRVSGNKFKNQSGFF